MTDVDVDRDGLEPGRTSVDHGITARVKRSDAWRSVFRHAQLDTPRGRALQSFSNFFLHLYPVKIPKRVLRNRYSFRLGFIAAVLFGILLVTGVYLMFVYTPSVGSAYGDMQNLKTGVGFGQLIRNIHRWAAHLMVLVVAAASRARLLRRRLQDAARVQLGDRRDAAAAHARVLVHRLPAALGPARVLGGHRRHRTSCTTSRSSAARPQDLLIGGPQVGQNTLLRFYALHVAVLPMLLVLMLAVHIWRVRKDGFAVQRTSVGAFAEEATERPAAAAAAAPMAAGRSPSCTAGASACSASSTASRSPRRSDPSTTRCSPGRTCWCATSWSRSGPRRSCSASRSRSARRSAVSRTRTSRRSRRRRPGTSPGSRSCSRASTRWSPASSSPRAPCSSCCSCRTSIATPTRARVTARSRSCCSASLLAIAVVLTVIGVFFRGPGWKFIAPWTHSYIEF